MAKSSNVIGVELGTIGNKCFVVMPFDPLYDTEYERVIRTVIENNGLECVRADEIYEKPRIMDDVWRAIRESRIVMAELTGRNPNVLYEVGLAHAIGKPVIILTRNEDDVPFDLRALRYLFYDINDPFWGDNLKKALASIVKAVLDDSDLSRYLEGISEVGTIEYPVVPEVMEVTQRSIAEVVDISGFWKGTFDIGTGREHRGTMSVQQERENVSATMTITYIKEDDISVVQEVFSGSINGREAKLRGVNYTWVKRGKGLSYGLDNFNLVLSQDGSEMNGECKTSEGNGKASFAKEIVGDITNEKGK